MKNLRILGKTAKICLSIFGIAALFSSCHKERDCRCTFSYDGYVDTYIITTKEKCWELDREWTYDGYLYTLECEKKNSGWL